MVIDIPPLCVDEKRTNDSTVGALSPFDVHIVPLEKSAQGRVPVMGRKGQKSAVLQLRYRPRAAPPRSGASGHGHWMPRAFTLKE
jgi:hypothetical protein